METAVALFFSYNNREADESPRRQLCSIVGPALTRAEADRLLQGAGSVSAAVDQYYAGQGTHRHHACHNRQHLHASYVSLD